jgi:hypothetical protein
MNPESLIQMANGLTAPTPEKPVSTQEELRSKLEKKFQGIKPQLDSGRAEYKQALKDGTFEDKDGEEVGSGEKKKKAMQKKLTDLLDKAEKMKIKLNSGEVLQDEPDSFPEIESFLLTTFKVWNPNTPDTLPFSPELVSSSSVDYKARKGDTVPSKYGEYTLNLDTVNIDWETTPPPPDKVTILEIPKCKNIVEAGEYLQNYLKTHPNIKLPGLELYKYVLDKPDSDIANKMKDGNYYFFFGSLFRRSDGRWSVPCVHGVASGLRRDGAWLGLDWLGNYRVVLLEN